MQAHMDVMMKGGGMHNRGMMSGKCDMMMKGDKPQTLAGYGYSGSKIKGFTQNESNRKERCNRPLLFCCGLFTGEQFKRQRSHVQTSRTISLNAFRGPSSPSAPAGQLCGAVAGAYHHGLHKAHGGG